MKNHTKFKKIIIVLFFLLGIIVYHSVSKAVRHKDMKYISIYLKGIDLPEDPQDLSYEEQINLIILIQANVLRISPKGEVGIPHKKERRPENLYLFGQGLCYDRSFTLELIFVYLGFETRHVGLFRDDPNFNTLKDLTKKGISSHSITEVLTKNGWLIIDSNKLWIGLDKNRAPYSMKLIEKSNFKVDWEKTSTTFFYNNKCHFLYGVYARHGNFHKPYNLIPDYNFQELFYNIN